MVRCRSESGPRGFASGSTALRRFQTFAGSPSNRWSRPMHRDRSRSKKENDRLPPPGCVVSCGSGGVQDRGQVRRNAVELDTKNSIPKGMLATYERIVALTDDVCDRQLNSEYRDLTRAMTGALCRKRPSPLTSGQPRTWAGGIVYVLGRINFLGDRSFPPYMTTADLCAAFGVGESTVHAKARVIEKALRIGVFDPKWALPSLVGSNPLVWMAEVDGLLVDLHTMPREIQEVAFAKGIIPYIPADAPDRS